MLEPTDNAPVPASNPDAWQRVLKVAFDLHNSGHHADAEALCRLLLPHTPQDSQLLLLLGMVLQKTGRSLEALKYLEPAAQLQPKSARILNSLGFVHQSLKNHARAVAYYAQAIELGLGAADTYYSMGNACHQLGEVERAAALFKKAVELKPCDVASWNNLGKCLNDSNRLEESIQTYDHALAIDPHYAMARYGRAVSLLAAGRLTEGFREYNQWRTHGIKPRQFPQPEWQGEAIPGRTLFLHAEQGFGDAIQYARFIPQVRERTTRVILECRPELKTFFTHCAVADIVIAYGETIPPFDYFTSLASLPGILGVTLATIPNQVPYLKISITGQWPPDPAGQLKVGVVWAGNPAHHNNAHRSLRLREFAPILQVPGVKFYSLQVPIPPQDETYFRKHFRSGPGAAANLVDLSGRFESFLATAAAVAELDLIIAVDTAVAHLAGALAKPVWTLLPFAPDWRWLLDREDTPWYPTMRLFRQNQRGQWPPVVARVAEELGGLASRKNDLPVRQNEMVEETRPARV
jgi:Tfp pilus assembly protein PilF